MDFIEESLELCPHPAAIFEAGDLRFVASNLAATDFIEQETGERVVPGRHAREVIQQRLGLSYEALQKVHAGSHSQVLKRGSYAHATYIAAGDQPRPDLVLLTIHPGVDQDESWYEHNRAVLSVKVNEMGIFAIQALENSMVMMASAITAQKDLLRLLNAPEAFPKRL